MFHRRLYFIVPDEPQAVKIVTDLETAGVDRRHIHAIAGKGTTLEKLPPANERQRRDTVWRLQQALWLGNLVVFALGGIGLIVSVAQGSLTGTILSSAVMVLTLTAGFLFATRVPDTHLDEFRGVLSHHEVLLMVDIPKQRVAEIEELIYRRHPEATAGGTGWTIEVLGI
ncbi:MAG: hypothetical protein A3E57_06015 [Candidatus Muproteobacteria bacterium RIFCSPHIGHO2_12_FULL_60_33]|uniref:DUF1269 domain-containing protein n=1 Tax=Candidatus Muproteobacteria bacterium RIFCSPLOWO2_01_FULL_60_18 TaxID=1817768 RepID=A0A1F6TZP3_9PROT|nr:MAG: hypothetical protein A2W42_02665 [Candidatus Muproteobacteria bacterium RIFCSPHIGHO2_01_60_12]OGI50577.1 MAG: hypothetical protein A3A87_05455 [Candidatus Muproteobacteria bacterium RIFCSPLOWO2_01_FULL_60_18]OGI56663.1 MAG: hypothetical protein A3E57_06015 [Candidatus Muproteobacteria bacterium RIFCSPHIGHO2_12_FULL_60_33]OGI58548.1 MAG: hypothetical protein A2809_05855 [Candidatus Muproteobacteria bacterium RIFCSPHIGHO2_01_FULL_61_200]